MKILISKFMILIISACLSEANVVPNPNEIKQYEEERKETSIHGEEVKIDFSSMGLSAIKPNFIIGSIITSLSLRDNSIQAIPENTFDHLPNLQYLDLSDNKLSKENLFTFGPLPSLKILILDNNIVLEDSEITELAHLCSDPRRYYRGDYRGCYERQEISNLEMKVEFPEVIHLSMRNIGMDSISGNWGLRFPKLNSLDISYNRLSSVDDFFERLPSTVKGLVMENVGFSSLRIREVRNFSSLNLNWNNFEIVSSNYCYQNTLCLKNLNNLEALSISECSINKIEADAFKDTQKLRHLDISNNNLDEIPAGTFGYLQSLEHLDISGNSFNVIPEISDLHKLESLKMNGMKNEHIFTSLWSLPSMPELRVLSLQNNKLTQIPSSFFVNLQGLLEIDLSNNQFTRLAPESWPKNLKRISLNGNRITSIEDLHLSEAPSLELLELERNNITKIILRAVKMLSDDALLKL